VIRKIVERIMNTVALKKESIEKLDAKNINRERTIMLKEIVS